LSAISLRIAALRLSLRTRFASTRLNFCPVNSRPRLRMSDSFCLVVVPLFDSEPDWPVALHAHVGV